MAAALFAPAASYNCCTARLAFDHKVVVIPTKISAISRYWYRQIVGKNYDGDQHNTQIIRT